MIQGGLDDCPIRMTIDNHEMKVISLDGNDIEPVTGIVVYFIFKLSHTSSLCYFKKKNNLICNFDYTVDVMQMYSGERADFILKANQKSDVYFIRFTGSSVCRVFGHQVALLRYKDVNKVIPEGSSDPRLIQLDRPPRVIII